jgi:hypothetical protein
VTNRQGFPGQHRFPECLVRHLLLACFPCCCCEAVQVTQALVAACYQVARLVWTVLAQINTPAALAPRLHVHSTQRSKLRRPLTTVSASRRCLGIHRPLQAVTGSYQPWTAASEHQNIIIPAVRMAS